MKNILIVAAREFRQITSMRSFWLTLLILPLALAAGPLTSRFLRDDRPDRVIILDRTGGEVAQSIERRFSDDADRKTLQAL
jgi:ABC-2 type transport system permease protein